LTYHFQKLLTNKNLIPAFQIFCHNFCKSDFSLSFRQLFSELQQQLVMQPVGFISRDDGRTA
jgi:hypothetical protein